MATTTTANRPKSGRSTTIFLKLLMAVSGAVFVAYVVTHMAGNLKVFGGADAFNTYAAHLRQLGEPILPHEGFLWIARAVLLTALGLHAYSAFKLWARSQQARSQRYTMKKAVGSSLSSRTMRWGGVALLLFVVFHILHLTTHTIHPQGDQTTPYDHVVNSFSLWWVTLLYVAAMGALALHLHHGVWSAAQTLGWTNTPAARSKAKLVGAVTATVVAVGFVVPPLGILFGLVN